MKIVIETIPHDAQRYDTAGDYWIDPDGSMQIRVSILGEWKHEALIAIHELVEFVLVQSEGITGQEIDDFDRQFLEHDGEGEAGDSLAAPYYFQHQVATGIERILAAELGVDWTEYDEAIEDL